MTRQQAQEAKARCETRCPIGINEFITHAEADLPAALEMLAQAMAALKEYIDSDCDGDGGYVYDDNGWECRACGKEGATKELIRHSPKCRMAAHDKAEALLAKWKER